MRREESRRGTQKCVRQRWSIKDSSSVRTFPETRVYFSNRFRTSTATLPTTFPRFRRIKPAGTSVTGIVESKGTSRPAANHSPNKRRSAARDFAIANLIRVEVTELASQSTTNDNDGSVVTKVPPGFNRF